MKTKLFAGLAAAGLLAAGLLANPSAQAAPSDDNAATRYVISFQNQAGASDADAANAVAQVADKLGVQALDSQTLATGAVVVTFDSPVTADDAAAAASGRIRAVEPTKRYVHTAAPTPNDPMWAQQWDMMDHPGINLPFANMMSKGENVVMAVLDTGYTAHPDLLANILPGYDMLPGEITYEEGGQTWTWDMGNDATPGRDADASDPGDYAEENAPCYYPQDPTYNYSSWHGTHVAGTVAALTDNGVGVAGVAGSGKILPVRVLGVCGGFTEDIVDGMLWAAGLPVPDVPANPNKAQVLNLSLGGYGQCSVYEQDAIDAVIASGSTVVISAGNENSDSVDYGPGNCEGVITVAATNNEGSLSYYSNYGDSVEVSAPGGELFSNAGPETGILSTLNAGTTVPAEPNYAYYQGTSMAAPHVAGVAGLAYSVNNLVSPTDVLMALQKRAVPVPAEQCVGNPYEIDDLPAIPDAGCGAGIIDAAQTLDELGGFVDFPVGQAFQQDAAWLAYHGISIGWNATDTDPDAVGLHEYRPVTPVHRDAMAAFLYRAAGSPAFTPPATPTYDDVPADYPFYTEIEWTADAGISFGWKTEEGLFFRPQDNIARDAMAAFLYRYAGSPAYTPPAVSPFTDVTPQTPFYAEMAWMKDQGISTGWADGTYRPLNSTNRDAMAAFLHRFANAGHMVPPPHVW